MGACGGGTTPAKCVDKYCALRVDAYEGRASGEIDPRLEAVVNRMFQRCYDDGQYRQALGIALEARRLDVLNHSLVASADVQASLSYALTVARTLVVHQGFRNEVCAVVEAVGGEGSAGGTSSVRAAGR